jgi:hypothetical protein
MRRSVVPLGSAAGAVLAFDGRIVQADDGVRREAAPDGGPSLLAAPSKPARCHGPCVGWYALPYVGRVKAGRAYSSAAKGLLLAACCCWWPHDRTTARMHNVMGLVLARNYFILFQSLPN